MLTHHDGVRVPLLGNPLPTVAKARLVAAAMLAIYAITFDPPAGKTEPAFVPVVALALVAALATSSFIQLTKQPTLARSPIPFIVVDGLVTVGFAFLYSFDPASYLFSLGFGVAIEAAFALGLSAALVTALALTIGYVVEEVMSNLVFEVPIETVSVILRVLTLLGVTLVVGSLVEASRATRAFSSEREKTEHLEEIDEMKTAFLAAVSHDLKNPLTAILGFSTTLERRLDRLPPERTLEFLGHITRSARRLERMVTDLLDVDRMQRGVLSPNLKPTDMAELVRGIVQEIELNNRPVIITAEDITATVDPPKVERIVENLVTNAIKYTPDDTEIGLSVSRHNGGVLIAVDDQGAGVPDDLKEKLFEPFQRAPGAAAQAKGSGLGLSLVSSFAELHGGRAWVEDRPGGGSSFRVYLPDGRTAASNS